MDIQDCTGYYRDKRTAHRHNHPIGISLDELVYKLPQKILLILSIHANNTDDPQTK
jgi:hypothetical protein